MGRPSLKEQRKEEILTALEDCVAIYGVAGSTLEKISEQAGLARALIRHHAGNRDDLINELIDRTLTKSKESMSELITHLPATEKSKALVNILFNERLADQKLNQIIGAMIFASHENRLMADKMRVWFEDFHQTVINTLKDDYQNSDEACIEAVATGITGIYFNIDSLATLGPNPSLRQQSRQAAMMLLNCL